MSDNITLPRATVQQVLGAIDLYQRNEHCEDELLIAGHFLRTALAQQAEPVAHAVVAGALFDFMGWLTTRKERLVLSSTDNASPAADAIKDFAEMRGLSLDDARVQDWQAYTTPPQRKPLTVQEIAAFVGTHQYGPEQLKWFRLGEAAHGIKEGT